MPNTATEVVDKLAEIARLKMEVMRLILPENTLQHLEVIDKEIKAMLREYLGDEAGEQGPPSPVRKVDIE